MRQVNLTLHCGANRVTREQVICVHTPNPTDTWFPIPHISLVECVEKALHAANMRVVNESHALTAEGNRYFGLLQVSNCRETEDFTYVLGLRNANDRSFKAAMVAGAEVFVCDNLSFNGEVRIDHKHTKNILNKLPVLASRAMGLLAEKWTTMTDRIARYKTTELSDAQAHDFTIRSLDAGACTLLQLPKILQEWRTPRHPEFVAAGKTAWRLFNAFTEIGKDSGIDNAMKRTINLHGLMDAQCGFTPVTAEKLTEGIEDAEAQVAFN